MKWRILLALFSLVIPLSRLSAQTCDQTTLMSTPGKWKPGPGGSTSGTAAADLAREKATITLINKMLQENYKPLGADASYSGVYYGNYGGTPKYPNSFAYSLFVLPYFCENGTLQKAHETNTTFYINANEMGVNIYEPDLREEVSIDGFFSIDGFPELKDGLYQWTSNVNLGMGMEGPQTTFLVTYDGQLPYLQVSRKEFLEKKKMLVQKFKSENVARISQDFPIEKDKQKHEDAMKRGNADYNATLEKIEKELQKPAAELNQPAIVATDPANYLLPVFTTPGHQYARTLIKPNPAYFNKKLPRSSPQFFSVVIKGNAENLVLGRAMKDLPKAVDFAKLKAMLGK
jgi:hypothetical protein